METNKKIHRSFIAGSEWLYYKLYAGPKTADFLLTDLIKPLTSDLMHSDLIDSWFFIRYADPKNHLRLRMHLPKRSELGWVIMQMHDLLQPLVEQGLVWKTQIDTYKREIERYGIYNMHLSEAIFHIDSLATVEFLDLIEGDEGEQLRWLFALRSTDRFLDSFAYSLDQKLALLQVLKDSFGKEFGMARPLKKQLDAKYRKEREHIEHFMRFTAVEEPDYAPLVEILEKRKLVLDPVASEILELNQNGGLEMPLEDLLGSYIHMLMNRLFKSKNRLNEMVCYDFLYRFYKTALAILNKHTQSRHSELTAKKNPA